MPGEEAPIEVETFAAADADDHGQGPGAIELLGGLGLQARWRERSHGLCKRH